jgi:ribA/ribD-fused uncharacterized protein
MAFTTKSDDGKEMFTLFYGYHFLSNFHSAPFFTENTNWNCGEQYFQFLKARHFGDHYRMRMISCAGDPHRAKYFGKYVQNFDKEDWDKVKYDYMKLVLLAKFSVPYLRNNLVSTGSNILVEASLNDLEWGIGLNKTDPLCRDRKNWKGKNLLGECLMEVRKILTEQKV